MRPGSGSIQTLHQSGIVPLGGRCHTLKNGKEVSEDAEESPAECAGEGKQNK